MTVDNLVELAGAAAIGYGAFMGWTKSNIKLIKESLARIENTLDRRLDKADEHLENHDIALATLPCTIKEECATSAAETAPTAHPPVGFVPVPAISAPADQPNGGSETAANGVDKKARD
jgi:hypothetical protein